MRCPHCQHANEATATFCEECGTRLGARACAACSAELKVSAKFCPSCGNRVGAPPGTAPERDVRAYTPKHLADKILQSKSAIEGERKQVSVLFADVKGSMELAEHVGPEVWHRILDRFFHILADGVHRFEGTVNQYTGDGIMALFGAPIAHEDHAQRACYAALQLRGDLERHATEIKREYGLGFSTRLGINSGEVVVGKIGDDLRLDYTALGHTVGLAQRMEALAAPDTCYVSAGTAAMVAGYFELKDLGEFRVKGAAQPVRVHQLLGTGPARTRFDVSRARGLTRFVGRASDMRTLEQALEQARSGQGQVVGVVADAGTGKSRLCFEFVERCRAAGIEVWEGHAVAHGKHIPLLPILQLFREFFGIDERDPPRIVREKVAGRMVLLDASFQEVLPILFEFLGAPDPARPAPRLDGKSRQRQLFALLRRVNELGPTESGVGVTLLEDLHWIDAASETFLTEMVETTGVSRNLLIVNFRPEYQAPWMRKSYYRRLPLTPLDPDAMAELLADILGRDASLDGLAARIYDRTAGNPFFTEEVARELIESGSVEGTPGAYRLTRPIGQITIPHAVRAVLAARIDRLPEREKQLLQAAAVIGKEFAEVVVQEIAGLSADDLAVALSALKDGEFIYEQALYPVAEYAFKHPLTQEVAYESQLADRRARTHAAVARVLQKIDADRLDERAALLSYHLEGAEEFLEAARWGERAAGWAMRTDVPEADRQARRVIGALDRAPAGVERDRVELAARAQLSRVHWRIESDPETERLNVDQARLLATKLGDDAAHATILANHALHVGLTEAEDVLATLDEAVRVADRLGDPELRVGTRAPLALFIIGGRLRQGIEYADGIIELAEHRRSLGESVFQFNPYVWARIFRGWARVFLGELEAGAGELERSAVLAREHGDPLMLSIWYRVRAAFQFHLGDPVEAVAALRRCHEIGERLGGVRQSVWEAGDVAALREAGENEEAVRWGEDKLGRHHPGTAARLCLIAELALAHLRAGNRKRALELSGPGAVVTTTARSHTILPGAYVALARVLRETDAPAHHVESKLREAESVIGSNEARVYTPSVVEERARLAAREGAASAERQLREAHRLYVEMGATGHAARLAIELASS